MRKRNIYIVILVLVIYTANKTFISIYPDNFVKTFISCYLNDILCGVLFPAYCNVLLERKYKCFKSLLVIEIILFLCGIFWEGIAPLFISYSVGDPIDIIAYMIGGFVYWSINKIHVKKDAH